MSYPRKSCIADEFCFCKSCLYSDNMSPKLFWKSASSDDAASEDMPIGSMCRQSTGRVDIPT